MYQESYIGSVTVYSKNLSSQCNLSEKIAQAQDIIIDYYTIKPCVVIKGIYYLSPDASSKGTIEMGVVHPSVRVLGFQMITCE